jgi:hypothetical protein
MSSYDIGFIIGRVLGIGLLLWFCGRCFGFVRNLIKAYRQ